MLQLSEDEVAIMNMEAGIEHFGRSTDNSTDAVLMAVDPSFEFLKLSEKVSEICAKVGLPVYYMLNRVTTENEAAMISKIYASEKIICKLLASDALMEAGLTGAPLEGEYSEIRAMLECLG